MNLINWKSVSKQVLTTWSIEFNTAVLMEFIATTVLYIFFLRQKPALSLCMLRAKQCSKQKHLWCDLGPPTKTGRSIEPSRLLLICWDSRLYRYFNLMSFSRNVSFGEKNGILIYSNNDEMINGKIENSWKQN